MSGTGLQDRTADQDPADVLRQLPAHLNAQGFDGIEIIKLGSEAPGPYDPDHRFPHQVADTAHVVYGVRQWIAQMAARAGT